MVGRCYDRVFAEKTFSQLDGRRLRLSGKPRGVLRAHPLRVVLDEPLASRRVLRVASECPADAAPQAAPDRPGRPRTRRRSAPGLRHASRWACTLKPFGDADAMKESLDRTKKGGLKVKRLGAREGLSTKTHLAVRGLGRAARLTLTAGRKGDAP
jgi:hypothetical protein